MKAFHAPRLGQNEPIRILTIDNGGLQAISVLQTLRTVCHEIAVKNNQEWKAPHELFDVIAGIGTGGWLALLLGRYKLDIDQCMVVYIEIADAVGSKRARTKRNKSRNPCAISQQRLMEGIEEIIERKELGRYMVDTSNSQNSGTDDRRCYAFAVGVAKNVAAGKHRLFRTYEPPHGASPNDPAPAECLISEVCAATAAAKHFMDECKIGNTVYCDESFPNTHCISKLALNEANLIFDTKQRPLSVIFNVGPGVPKDKQIKQLRSSARSNGTVGFRIKDSCRRALSPLTSRHSSTKDNHTDSEADTDNGPQTGGRRPSATLNQTMRSPTGDSAKGTCERATRKESSLQAAIKERLRRDYGDEGIYCRLALDTEQLASGKTKAPLAPYMNDIDDPWLAGQLTEKFLQLDASLQTIHDVAENYTMQWSKLPQR